MNAHPLVSIVTPSLNQGQFIQSTIDSILSQGYSNLEYWVIDGGSSDETLDILHSYGDRLQWVSESDSGQSQAVNKGWQLSHGDILGWVNADDLLQPAAIRTAVEALSAQPAIGAVYGDTAYIDNKGKFIQPYPTCSYNYANLVKDTEDYIPQPSVFMRRSVLEKAGWLNEKLHFVMDYDLWLRIGLITSMRYIPKPMAMLRLHPAAKTVKATSKFANEFVSIFQDLIANPTLPTSLQQRRTYILHRVCVHAASFCFWGGEQKLALEYLRRAWELQSFPRQRTFWLLLAFSMLGKPGWKLAEYLHGNPMQLKKGVLIR